MSTDHTSVSVTILGKEFRIGCAAGEESAVRDAAHLLDERMQSIRSSGKVIGIERIAVMAALNLAHEVQTRGDVEEPATGATRRIQGLRDRIEVALNDTNQLEL